MTSQHKFEIKRAVSALVVLTLKGNDHEHIWELTSVIIVLVDVLAVVSQQHGERWL